MELAVSNIDSFQLSVLSLSDACQSRTGALLLPTYEIGSLFMREYCGKQPRRAIRLGLSRTRLVFRLKPPSILCTVQPAAFPVAGPHKQVQSQKVQQTLSCAARVQQGPTVGIHTIQFGWECRDNTYSIEFEKTGLARSHLIFDEDHRQFRLHLVQSEEVLSIVLRASQVVWASIDPSGAAMFFSLASAPTYEASGSVPDITRRGSIQLSALDSQHEEYTPYTSYSLRVLCGKSAGRYNTLRSMCQAAHISVHSYVYFITRQNIFSVDVRARYNAWLAAELFDIAFQVDAIARAGVMDLQELLKLKPHLEKMRSSLGSSYTAGFIRYLGEEARATSWYTATNPTGPVAVDRLIKFYLRCKKTFNPSMMLPFSDAETFPCYHVTITPSRFILSGPFPERNNRVMRKYASHTSNFLRVDFADEEGFQYRMDRVLDSRRFVRERFGRFLSQGFVLVDRHFDFLQWSQSGLKQHAVWFVKEFQMSHDTVTVDSIIADLGTFHDTPYDPRLMYCPARLGARRALAFTTTDAAVEVEAEEIVVEPDIEDANGKRSFTDGAGLISEELMTAVWEELRKKSRRYRRAHMMPDVIQHRFQGSKGTSTVSRRLPGRVLVIRPSMIKFEATGSRMVEVAAAFTRAGPFRLNRPLIMLLEGLRIRGGYEILKKLQDAVIQETKDAANSLSTAARLLEPHGLGTGFKVSSVFANLARLELDSMPDPFFHRVLNVAIYHILRDLKYHARIPVPGGYTLVGVADPYGYLGEGEVFACVTTSTNAEPIFLEGEMMISRSPTVHPGDVQIVRAIGRPPKGSEFDKHPIMNALVFATIGKRPPASCLGNGDLDGDVYVCTTKEELLPKQTRAPASYDAAARKEVPHQSTQQDMADFVTEFICSDNIGIIASRWLELADKRGIFDPGCLRLAYLHSLATDYPKTGLPVPLEYLPGTDMRRGRPDWSAPETEGSRRFYQSTRYLGRLFREVRLPVPPHPQQPKQTYEERLELGKVTAFFRDDSRASMNAIDAKVHDFVYPYIQAAPLRHQQRIKQVWELFSEYVPRLRSICLSCNLYQRRSAMLTEEEIVAGTIVAHTSQPALRKERMSQMREQISLLTEHIATRLNGDDNNPHEVLKRAWAAYRLPTLRPESFGSKSFRFIAIHEIFDAVKRIVAEDSQAGEGAGDG
ncbi:uncharacterized protein PHACADRAFT_173705 [Phanerochaete carnosa HHB-10118-sp]|uniref:RNA-dependent RNA polymerase n=1 Tax=Phanerochaete carnosa (strain HHB-10118-sp) TaxID=650164 RepID=K5VVI9_PHACS|nr:uncharacterized protein PHACADRAFT_173705 [Phanerochaete carnosa HHB-10118-sp]EKM55558.1 hypothetical protein PHACADRAFT_173705 [Phanerochaete carnosa HHB-10118-sp]